jgi:vanillate O-demethylase ferredoxin subunit
MMRVAVKKKQQAAEDICLFELADPKGAPLPPFTAGAHIDVQAGPGLMRQYSLCNAPGETHRYVIGVLKDPESRGGSLAMHALEEGALVEISAPKNHFPLEEKATHSILLAGGIGVTPILSMAESLAAAGASFEMHYCTRSPERTAFRERLAQPDLKDRARIYFDSDPSHRRIDLAKIFAQPSAGSHVYVCGPGGFIDFVLSAARQAGWPDANLHREYFSAATHPVGENTAFSVQIASSGATIEVPADQSVVKALAAHGVDILTSCEEGVCGTCLTRVLSGIPDHRDAYLTDEEKAAGDQFLPCCSRSKTPLLVLDL